MSRVANQPITIPAGVDVQIVDQDMAVKGKMGSLSLVLASTVTAAKNDGQINVSAKDAEQKSIAMAGTTRALIANMVQGVSSGFVRRLLLVGVGYRAQAQGQALNLQLGFSHPVAYKVPAGITVETPSVTEIIIRGANKQVVGQVAAEIRAFRPPEPYKGKGVRYDNEKIVLKEAKKK